MREINKQQVKDIIRELKHENKLRPFQPEPSPSGGKLGMFAAPLPMKMQQAKFGGAHPNIVKDKYSHKLLGNEMVAEFSQGLGLPRSMAEDIKDAEKLSLPEFVDEMQERYVTKLEFE